MAGAVVALVGSRAGSAVAARVLPPVDRWVWRVSGQRHTLSALATGAPVVLLRTTGARSGLPRTSPLIAVADADDVVVVASDFARPREPAWLLNLRADPHATLSRSSASWPVVAVEVRDGPERDRLWAAAVATYPPWAAYERRARRHFPLVRLRSSA